MKHYHVVQSVGTSVFEQSEVVAAGADCTVGDACDPYTSQPQVRRALPVDINADGLADFAFLDAFYDWRFRLNRGAGFLAPSAPIAAFADEGQSRYGAFVDLTGDQLPDLVYPSVIGSQAAVWILHRNLFGAAFAAAVNTGDAFGNSENSDQSLLLDFTGDGMADNLFIDLDASGAILASSTKLFDYTSDEKVIGTPPYTQVIKSMTITYKVRIEPFKSMFIDSWQPENNIKKSFI